jgi:hypothetical protein
LLLVHAVGSHPQSAQGVASLSEERGNRGLLRRRWQAIRYGSDLICIPTHDLILG